MANRSSFDATRLLLLRPCLQSHSSSFRKVAETTLGGKKRGPNDLCWLPEKRGLRSIALATISSSSCCNSERTKKKKEEEGLTKETYTYQICMIEQSRKDLLIISQGQGIGNFYGLRRKPITTRALSLTRCCCCTLYPQINMKAAEVHASGLKGKTVTKVYYVSMQKKFPDCVMKTSTYFD